MKIVVQRVKRAEVKIDNQVFSKIGKGLLLLICAMEGDTQADADVVLAKILKLRTFDNPESAKIMDKSVVDLNLDLLLVSQFTLAGTFKKGNRPDFTGAMRPDPAKEMYNYFVQQAKNLSGLKVETGEFGADMDLDYLNDGPVTYIFDSKDFL